MWLIAGIDRRTATGKDDYDYDNDHEKDILMPSLPAWSGIRMIVARQTVNYLDAHLRGHDACIEAEF